MKKQALAVLVAGLFAAPAIAHADGDTVTLYGIAQVGVMSANNGAVTQNKVEDTGSRIGVKGTENLGGDLSAFFKIESGVDLAGATSGKFASREGWVGLASKDWGAIKLGRGKTYFDLVQENFDGFEGNDTMIDSLLIDGVYYRINNAIAYETPDLSGFTAKFEYADMEGKTSTTTPYTFIGVAEYNAGPLYLTAAIESQHNLTGNVSGGSTPKTVVPGARVTNTFIGGGYTLPTNTNLKLGWRHSDIQNDTTLANNGKRNAWIGVVTQTWDNQYILRGGVMKAGDKSSTSTGILNNDSGGTYWAVGAEWDMSKRTLIYTEYAHAKNGQNANSFLTTDSAGQAANTFTNSTWSTGIIHLF